MGVRQQYGENEDGSWSVCRALPENVGRYGCHHVSHGSMTKTEAQERNEKIISDGVRRSHRLDRSMSCTDFYSMNPRAAMDAAMNPSTTSKTLERLSHSRDDDVVLRVAANQSASPELLRSLAEDGSFDEGLAENENAPDDVLRKVVSREGIARAIVASNPGTSPELLTELAECHYDDGPETDDAYSSFGVRNRVVANPSTPFKVVERLSHDEDEIVASNAREVLQTGHRRSRWSFGDTRLTRS